jgi:hypothetical protein
MALRDWQLALGQMVAARAAGRDAAVTDLLAGLDLDDAERAWLAGVRDTRGFGLTGFVPRWWRETRVRRAARLTVAALGDAAAGHLRDYLRAVPSFTLFFVPKGLAFIDYVAALPVPELVHSVGRFERAMWLARFEPQRPPTVIEFAAPPDLVLGAALQGQPLPAPSAELHFIVVDPGVAGRWRIATADDVAALERSTTTWPPSP